MGEYSGSIEYGIETSDFDELMDTRLQSHQASELHGGPKHLLRAHCLYGDQFLGMARMFNLMFGVLSVPAFAILQWVNDTHESVQGKSFFTSPYHDRICII